jgi:CheY-like chemotaxis protein
LRAVFTEKLGMSTILIVDDLSANRKFLVTLLGYHGHRLLEAAEVARRLPSYGPSVSIW